MWKTAQKSTSRHHFISLSLSGAHQRNAAQQHHQMLIAYRRLPGADLFAEGLIATTLQALGIDHKTIAFPHQELHSLPAFAEEHIDRATQWIRPQFIAHQPTETVVALAHIGAALVDEILLMGTKP